MKPWCVVGYDAPLIYDVQTRFGRGNAEGRRDVVGYTYHLPTPDARGSEILSGVQRLYFADDEVSATTIATYLSTQCPNVHWIVAKSVSAMRSVPAAPAKSTFSDKGLLP